MENALKALERYFDSANDTELNRGFTLGVVDYVDFVKITPELLELVNTLTKEKEKFVKELNALEEILTNNY